MADSSHRFLPSVAVDLMRFDLLRSRWCGDKHGHTRTHTDDHGFGDGYENPKFALANVTHASPPVIEPVRGQATQMSAVWR
jgi:hypothetical protein